MRTDKLAVLAIILGVGYLMFKSKGAPPAPRQAMPVYHPPARRFPIKVYHPPARRFPIKVYHPPARRFPIIHFPPILGHQFPHPLPKRRFFR